MNTKENWLIAWSITRSLRTCNTKITKTSKEVKFLLKKSEKCFCNRENFQPKSYKERLDTYIEKKGFQKRWTGWKYTWIKKEEDDVPF